MQIFVRSSGATYVLDVAANDTVHHLKNEIFLKESIPASEQRIHFSGKDLQDPEQLSGYDLTNGSTVVVLLRIRGGMPKKGKKTKTIETPEEKALREATEVRSAWNANIWEHNSLERKEEPSPFYSFPANSRSHSVHVCAHLLLYADKWLYFFQKLKAEEDRRRKEEGMRKKLTEDLVEEAKFAKLNLAKIQNQWRKLMRLAKVETLRKDLEIMSQNHEREVDMKDAIIQMLDRDRKRQISSPQFHMHVCMGVCFLCFVHASWHVLSHNHWSCRAVDEAEEQYQMALRSHLQNVDALIDLYNSKVRQLESEFEAEIRQMQNDFQTERTEIVTKHAATKGELMDMIELVEQQFKESEAEAKQDFDSYCEELKNKNLEDRNVLKLMLEAQIETLENHFANAAETYDQTTRQRTQQFRNLTQKDRTSAQTIEAQLKRLQRLQDTLAHWRMKIASNVKECEERNRLMREERDQISRHFQVRAWCILVQKLHTLMLILLE